jgi:hypothetical protein
LFPSLIYFSIPICTCVYLSSQFSLAKRSSLSAHRAAWTCATPTTAFWQRSRSSAVEPTPTRRRPAYAPVPARGTAASRSGIIAFSCQPSDDKSLALCEFVAADPAALRPILSDRLVKSFEKGKAQKADVETEFKKYKKDFDLDKFLLRVP